MHYKIICRTDATNKNGEAPLYLQFYHEGRRKKVTTGVAINPRFWDDMAQQLTPDCPNRDELQFRLNEQIRAYEKKMRRLEALDIPVTFETLLERKANDGRITIEDGFLEQIHRLEALGKINSATKHKYALHLISRYKPISIALEAIDTDYLKGLELFLRQRGNSDNSIATRFAIFKAIYNKAIREGKINAKQNPFSLYHVGSLWAKTRKRAITKEDVQRLAELELARGSRLSYRVFARDIFLFSYYTAGMNFTDIATLRYCDIVNGRISYSRNKTQKLLSFRLMPKAMEVIEHYSRVGHSYDDYIFPILDKRIHVTPQQIFNRTHKVLRKVNRELKILGKMIGLQIPLTTYVARHTYATVLKRSGVNIAIISESLGHSDLSTTQIYLDSFENSQIDEAMKHLL